MSSQDEFYVAVNGADSNAGTKEAPFRTIQKCVLTAVAGQRCIVREGTYRETVRPANSGTAGAPIVFAAFDGELVTVSGADEVSGWQPYQGNIYRAAAALPVSGNSGVDVFANQLFVDRRMQLQARWPNGTTDLMKPVLANGGLSIDSALRKITLTGADIPVVPGGWKGAVVWTNEWFVSRTGIFTQSEPGRLSADLVDTSTWDRGFWYMLTGVLGALDSPGEWHYQTAEQLLYLWAPDGQAPIGVEVKQRNYAFDFSDRSHITVKNVKTFASTITTNSASERITLDGLDAQYVSHYITLPELPASRMAPNTDGFGLIGSHTHDSGIQLRGKDHILQNSRVAFSAGNLVLLEGLGHRVFNNILHDANYMSTYAAAVQIVGKGHQIKQNTIYNSGRSAINVDWKLNGTVLQDIEIAYNDMRTFGAISADLGAIYVCCRMNTSGTRIHHNRIHNPYVFSPFWDVVGIYFDLNSYNGLFDHNVIYSFSAGERSYSLKLGNEFSDSLDRLFNNVLMHPSTLGGRIEARNNIFGVTESFLFTPGTNNLSAPADPLFADKASGNFSLNPGSPAIDQGITVPGLDSEVAGSAPDIGAFETGVVPWTAGVTPVR